MSMLGPAWRLHQQSLQPSAAARRRRIQDVLSWNSPGVTLQTGRL